MYKITKWIKEGIKLVNLQKAIKSTDITPELIFSSVSMFFFLERELWERALKYTHFELKNVVINKSKFPQLN